MISLFAHTLTVLWMLLGYFRVHPWDVKSWKIALLVLDLFLKGCLAVTPCIVHWWSILSQISFYFMYLSTFILQIRYWHLSFMLYLIHLVKTNRTFQICVASCKNKILEFLMMRLKLCVTQLYYHCTDACKHQVPSHNSVCSHAMPLYHYEFGFTTPTLKVLALVCLWVVISIKSHFSIQSYIPG